MGQPDGGGRPRSLSPPPLEGEGHFPFESEDFARVRALIYREAGIALSPAKRDMVYSRLARRLRALGLARFRDYLDLVESGEAQELEAFVNALTTNMTSFFREPHHFRMLADSLAQQGPQRLRIWSCAASSGEEPYSIAMTVQEALGRRAADVRILATDIDTNVLAKARLGIYPLEQLQKMPEQRLRRFFLRGEGKQRGLARVKEELRGMVSFRQLNLLDSHWPMQGRFDFVFCRNVMIYFDRKTQQAILERIAARLTPQGLLFVGHSESFHGAQELFAPCGNTAYRLREGGTTQRKE